MFASAVNRTRGPSMATMDFTTKPLMLLFLMSVLHRAASQDTAAGILRRDCKYHIIPSDSRLLRNCASPENYISGLTQNHQALLVRELELVLPSCQHRAVCGFAYAY
jgi:hypothetical protein